MNVTEKTTGHLLDNTNWSAEQSTASVSKQRRQTTDVGTHCKKKINILLSQFDCWLHRNTVV